MERSPKRQRTSDDGGALGGALSADTQDPTHAEGAISVTASTSAMAASPPEAAASNQHQAGAGTDGASADGQPEASPAAAVGRLNEPGAAIPAPIFAQVGVPVVKPAPLTVQVFFDNPDAFDASAEILHQSVNVEGDTALYLAAKTGNEAAVRALLAVPATECDKQNHKGITPLSIAAHKGKQAVVELLLAHKPPAAVNRASNNGSTPLIQASHFGHLDVVDCLLAAGAQVDQSNKKGTTSLMRATQEGNEAVVRKLIRAGADVNIRNNERMNALMLGSQRGHAHIVKVLIDYGAEIDGQTAQGSTALMLACKRGHTEVVRVLLTAGAEMFGQDSRGRTAKETAAKRHHTKITDMLTGRSQTWLMQNEARTKRSLMLSWLYKAHCSGDPVQAMHVNEDIVAKSPSMAMLRRVFELNEPVFERIVQLMPLPRLWKPELQRLQRRCNINPNEAINGAMRLQDEIFTDLSLVKEGPQESHIPRVKADLGLQTRLVSDFGMPRELLDEVLRQEDVHSVLNRMPAEVKFDASAAQKVVSTASDMLRWYASRENGLPYRYRPADGQLSPNDSGGGSGGDAAAMGGHASNGANTEDESSDGEMDG